MKILFALEQIDFIDPIGLMLVSGIARSKGHDTRLIVLSRDDVLETARSYKPDIMAYSSTTGAHKSYIKADKVIKDNFGDIISIMGGPHATFYEESLHRSTIDVFCKGEGDGAFAEFLDAVESGQPYADIQNLITKSKDNPIRPLLEDLDEIPFCDRDLIYKSTEMGDFAIKSFLTSRGCPYPCTYCFNHAFKKMYAGKGKLLRRHSVDRTIEEILRVKKDYNLEFVKFYDDIFVYKVDDWLEEFRQKYREKVNLPFQCYTRCDLISEPIAKILKDAGCASISMSIEAGNPDLRKNMLRRNMDDETIISAFRLCETHGIRTFANTIVGLPYSTTQDDIKSVDLNIESKVTFAEFPIFTPYPKTELGDYCIKEGLFDGDFDNIHPYYEHKSPLNCFTEKEKLIQLNISEFGTVAVAMPFLRNLIIKRLIYLPFNLLAFISYYLVKVYLIKTKIYPIKVRAKDFISLLKKGLSLEKSKRRDESK